MAPILLLASWAAALIFSQQVKGATASDLIDTVALYDSTDERSSDINFRKISEYYGLKWSQVDLSSSSLQASHFRDEQGLGVRAAHITAAKLKGMSSTDLDLLKTAVATNGLNLLVSEITENNSELSNLTSGEVTGAYIPSNKGYKYFITNNLPDVSRQFSGQTIETQNNANDFALNITPGATQTVVIINGGSSPESIYPVFARYRQGNGSIFLQSTKINSNLNQSRLWQLYYAFRSPGMQYETYQDFSRLVPLLIFMRYAAGEETWHSKQNYANLTLDDPPLIQPFWGMSYTNNFYTDLLPNMKSHNFHTTIAFVPKNYLTSQASVTQLFRDNPNYYSLAVHGNDHLCPELPSLAGQDELQRRAKEALWRMTEHERLTGVPFGKEMVFPCEQFDMESLKALKYAGFLSTVNGKDVPLDAVRPIYWDYGMYQAELDYNNFANVPRMGIEWSTPLHELFIGRPLLVFDHPAFFQTGMHAFNNWANQFNAIAGGLEWRSLDYITKRLYLEKTNDDQSISVKFYTGNVIVKNAYSTDKLFRFIKKETLDLPITTVKANGIQLPFTFENGLLQFEVTIPAGQESEITLQYSGEVNPTPGVSPTPSPIPSPTPSSNTINAQVVTSLDDTTVTNGVNKNADYPILTQNNRNAGVRFQNITIPQGATITSAYIETYLHSSSYDDIDVNIYGDFADHSLNFADTNTLVNNRLKTSAFVLWNAGNSGTGYKKSPDISSVVQEIVNRGGWQSGNSISMLMFGNSGSKMEGCSFDNTITGSPWAYACLNNPPKLHISYATSTPTPTPSPSPTPTPSPNPTPTPTPAPTPPASTGQVDSNIITSLDDATDNYSSAQRNNDYPLITQTDINGVRSSGLRFQNIAIPKGATITTAYVQINVPSSSYDDLDITVYGEATDSPLNFDNTNPFISSRAKTTANSVWMALNIGTGYKQSPELKSIIQEIVNRSNWQSGNSLNVLMLGRSLNKVEACSFDNTLSGSGWAWGCLNNPPKLHVEYAL